MKSLQILGMRKEEKGFSYYINENGTETWVDRRYLLENYPDELCTFYEERIVFE